jgi:apolipoprotein N-acyltransferase
MSSKVDTLPLWRRSTLAVALVGSLLLWAALPPLALGWLAWIAPVPWLLLVLADEMPGRRPYWKLYFAGFVFWMLTIQWLRLPHPLTSIGWVALSAYLAAYFPAFVAITRTAMFRFALPLWLAAPIVWTGLELARAHLLTGFLMASIAHTQVNWTTLIQISDLVGEYGVDFLILLVASCITQMLHVCGVRLDSANPQSAIRNPKSKLWQVAFALTPAAIALVATLAYGHWCLAVAADMAKNKFDAGPRIALIQGNSLAEWKLDPNRERQIMEEYMSLSERAVAAASTTGDGRPVDLVVWPETMFRIPLFTFDGAFRAPAEAVNTPEQFASYAPRELSALVARLKTPILVGIDRAYGAAPSADDPNRSVMQQFNSAVLVGRDGKIVGTYDKMHRVMFGEYIPFADWIPYLYKLTPLTGGIIAGTKPAGLWLRATYCFAPNICYETAIPHVIRRQVAALNASDNAPVALVNLTNDAWYWGSSELDMHLACDVFRAVETRVPLVVAANGGISASIDRLGRVRERCGKQTSEFLLADVAPGFLTSWYVQFGDWFAGLCLACCIAAIIVEWRARRALGRRSLPPSDAAP